MNPDLRAIAGSHSIIVQKGFQHGGAILEQRHPRPCDQTLDDIRTFIAEGGGKASDFVEFYTNDDLYSVAYYYLDRP